MTLAEILGQVGDAAAAGAPDAETAKARRRTAVKAKRERLERADEDLNALRRAREELAAAE